MSPIMTTPAIKSLPRPAPNGKSVIIVGAGAGGIALAARLSKQGFSVTVLEKNDFLGGRCSLLHRPGGYRFDVGPSLLLLREYFDETFQDLGLTLPEAGVDLLKCNPNYEVHFADGDRVRLSTDLGEMKEEIDRWEGPGGMERYLDFLKEAGRHARVSGEYVLRRNFYSVFSLARLGFLRYINSLHPFESCWRRVNMYMKSERMRRCLTFGCMYLGMSPYDAPGTYSLLQYTELAEGIFYPVGGFHVVLSSLASIAAHFGATFRLSTPVSRVLISPDGTASGVELASGAFLNADAVILNCDLVHAYTNLLPPSPEARALQNRHHSCSSISFYWSLNRKVPALTTHNIFLASEYRDSFDAIFNRQEMPKDPSFYVNVPSRIDPTAAPENGDAITVLVPIGHLTGEGDQPKIANMVEKARRWVLQTVKLRTGEDLRDAIIDEQINTPFTWQETFNLTHGAILGLSHSFFNVLSFRPGINHPKYKNLHFVGASTHPGTGVPVCLAGAKLTQVEVERGLGMREMEGWGELLAWVRVILLGLALALMWWVFGELGQVM